MDSGKSERTRARKGFRFVWAAWAMVLMLAVTGCATVLTANQQLMEVSTGDVEGASCTLSDSRGRVWEVPSTPGRTVVERGGGVMTVVCSKVGYSDSLIRIDATLSLVTFGNAVIQPLVGGGVLGGVAAASSLTVDAISGRARGYPRRVTLAMVPGNERRNSTVTPPSPEAIRANRPENAITRGTCRELLLPGDVHLTALGDASPSGC